MTSTTNSRSTGGRSYRTKSKLKLTKKSETKSADDERNDTAAKYSSDDDIPDTNWGQELKEEIQEMIDWYQNDFNFFDVKPKQTRGLSRSSRKSKVTWKNDEKGNTASQLLKDAYEGSGIMIGYVGDVLLPANKNESHYDGEPEEEGGNTKPTNKNMVKRLSTRKQLRRNRNRSRSRSRSRRRINGSSSSIGKN